MKIPVWILSVFLGGTVAWATWVSHQLVELKADVAVLAERTTKGGEQ